MDSWQDSKRHLAGLGIIFAAFCAAFYFASVSVDAAHPVRDTMLFAVGVVVVSGATSILWALCFVPLIKLMMRLSGKTRGRQPDEQ